MTWARAQGVCSCCKSRPATDWHHRWSQVKWAKKLYGKLIHHPANLQAVCSACHSSHANPNLDRWTEAEFAAAVGVEMKSKLARSRS